MSAAVSVNQSKATLVSVIVVAGVSGSGKSTVGEALATRLGWSYSEADDFHPSSNIAKMSAGIPLTDEDRAPWLAKIAAFIASTCENGGNAIVSCSALKRAYRKTLVGDHADRVKIIMLAGSEDQIAARLSKRHGHFMPPALLHSQFKALEQPQPDEGVIVVPIDGTPNDAVSRIVEQLKLA